jgi:hypothetical protein
MRCGGKWSRDHQCPAAVQLHVVQELLDIFQVDDSTDEALEAPEPAQEQLFLSLSVAAVTGVILPRTMCFWGQLGDQHIKILLDSGSSHTFISSEIAAKCSALSELHPPLTVQVANGQTLLCSSHIPSAVWFLQGCQFTSDLKVLPLSTYDMILGLDWLELHSPMEVHWAQKWIHLQHQGHSVHLQHQGHSPCLLL